jgi:hypothetical protein
MTIRPGEGKDLGSGSCGGANKEVEAINQSGKAVDALDRRVLLMPSFWALYLILHG